jgi:hypothetical protein
MSQTKLALPGIIPGRESLASDILAGDGKIANLFLQCKVDNNTNASIPLKNCATQC